MNNKKQFGRRVEVATLNITKWIGSPLSIILHTVFFIAIFLLVYVGISIDKIMLILTTAVSLEAIYLSLFIQLSVNNNLKTIEGVEEDIDDIQEDMEEAQTSIDMIEHNVQFLSKDVQDISKEIDQLESIDEPVGTNTSHALKNLHAMLLKVSSDISFIEKDIKNLRTAKDKQHVADKKESQIKNNIV